MLRTPAYHRNRQTVRDSITNYTQVNELGVRNMHDMHGATCTSQPQPKSLRIRLLSIEALGNPGTISRHIICSGQLFAQFFRGHPEELPEAQRGQLQAQEAVRRLILSVPGPELV